MSTPDDFNELQEMMTDLPMREPSQMLDARIASTLETPTRAKLPWLAIAAAVLVAATVTLVIVFNPGTTTLDTNPQITAQPPYEGPAILPVRSQPDTLNLIWSRDVVDELRFTPAGEPYRAVVREAVDHRAWTNSETGESGHLCVPHEELIVVKQSTF